jgi:hypothetical protein
MKFEINENKLEKVIFKYLDNKNFIIKETDYNYYFLENEEDEYAQIRVRKNNNFCSIYYRLTGEIESFFSIETPMAKKGLTRYVENTLNIKVSTTFDKLFSLKKTLRIPN